MTTDPTMLVFLEQHEIDRFALWLEQEADSSIKIAAEIEKQFSTGAPAEVLVKRERGYALAARVVADRLRNIEIVGVER